MRIQFQISAQSAKKSAELTSKYTVCVREVVTWDLFCNSLAESTASQASHRGITIRIYSLVQRATICLKISDVVNQREGADERKPPDYPEAVIRLGTGPAKYLWPLSVSERVQKPRSRGKQLFVEISDNTAQGPVRQVGEVLGAVATTQNARDASS